jgi:hypothetical protein
VDQGIPSKSTLQVGFTGIVLREQAALCCLFGPDLSTYPSRYSLSRGYVRKQTEYTQEYCVSESISDMLKMAISGLKQSRRSLYTPPPEAAYRGVMEM